MFARRKEPLAAVDYLYRAGIDKHTYTWEREREKNEDHVIHNLSVYTCLDDFDKILLTSRYFLRSICSSKSESFFCHYSILMPFVFLLRCSLNGERIKSKCHLFHVCREIGWRNDYESVSMVSSGRQICQKSAFVTYRDSDLDPRLDWLDMLALSLPFELVVHTVGHLTRRFLACSLLGHVQFSSALIYNRFFSPIWSYILHHAFRWLSEELISKQTMCRRWPCSLADVRVWVCTHSLNFSFSSLFYIYIDIQCWSRLTHT